MAVVAAGATHAVRVAFPEPVVDGLQLQACGVALARAARRIVGQDEPTSIERQAAELAAIRTFVTRVVGVESVTPGIRQVTSAVATSPRSRRSVPTSSCTSSPRRPDGPS